MFISDHFCHCVGISFLLNVLVNHFKISPVYDPLAFNKSTHLNMSSLTRPPTPNNSPHTFGDCTCCAQATERHHGSRQRKTTTSTIFRLHNLGALAHLFPLRMTRPMFDNIYALSASTLLTDLCRYILALKIRSGLTLLPAPSRGRNL